MVRAAKEIKRKYLSTYFGVLFHPLVIGVVIGIGLGVYIQTNYQQKEIEEIQQDANYKIEEAQSFADSLELELKYCKRLGRLRGY